MNRLLGLRSNLLSVSNHLNQCRYSLFHCPRYKSETPTTSGSKALVLNCGSSTIKFTLFNFTNRTDATQIINGAVDRIGANDSFIKYNGKTLPFSIQNHEEGIEKIMDVLQEEVISDPSEIKVCGHRVVHGGDATVASVIDDVCFQRIKDVSHLAPLHNPQNLKGIEIARKYFKCEHVAVFDNAFHAQIPKAAHMYAIPKSYYYEHNVRKYGFHGSSYQYILEQLENYLEKPREDISCVIMHLGSGASMAAIQNGQCIDTSMGYSPLEGLVMSTRSGDIDPTVLEVISEKENLQKVPDLINFLNKKCGLESLCGEKDFREIHEMAKNGNVDAQNAQDIFVHRVRRYLGSYLLQLNNRVDAIIFTAGVGENSAIVRELVCEQLDGFGIVVDKEQNSMEANDNVREIQAMNSAFKILVFPTDEEYSIAKQSLEAAKVNIATGDLSQGETGDYITKGKIYENTEGLYVMPIQDAETSLVDIGIMSKLCEYYEEVGYFRAIAKSDSAGKVTDRRVKLMADIFKIDDHGLPASFSYGVTQSEAKELLRDGKMSILLDKVVDKYQTYKKHYDMVVISGFKDPEMMLLGDFQVGILEAINVPTLLVYTCRPHDSRDVALEKAYESVSLVWRAISNTNAEISGAFVNRLPMKENECSTLNIEAVKSNHQELYDKLSDTGVPNVSVFPSSGTLTQVHLDEVAAQLYGSRVLFKSALELGQVAVQSPVIASNSVATLIDELYGLQDPVVIIDSSRVDFILSLLMVAANDQSFKINAIIVANGHRMNQVMLKRWLGFKKSSQSKSNKAPSLPIPIVSTKLPENKALQAINKMKALLYATSEHKIAKTKFIFDNYLNMKWLDTFNPETKKKINHDITPKIFQHSIFTKARANLQTIVLPEGEDKRVLTAASYLHNNKYAKIVLLGNTEEVRRVALQHGLDISQIEILNPSEATPERELLRDKLYELRKNKGMSLEAADDIISNPNYYATMMMHESLADGIVSGAIHTTADTMRPALQLIKTRIPGSLVSSIFFMLLPSRVFVYGDCAINVDPTADQLADIAVASALTAKQFDIDPRVAMLSYATGDSNSGPMIQKVQEATKKAQQQLEDIPIEGPFQFDAATNIEVAKIKVKTPSKVAGAATVCVFPDLNTGNTTYKAVQQSTGCIAMGPIMQGLRLPVNDLSRGCTVEDIINTVIITSVQAIGNK